MADGLDDLARIARAYGRCAEADELEDKAGRARWALPRDGAVVTAEPPPQDIPDESEKSPRTRGHTLRRACAECGVLSGRTRCPLHGDPIARKMAHLAARERYAAKVRP